MWRPCSLRKLNFKPYSTKVKSPFDISEFARQLPDAEEPTSFDTNQLDWSHLKQDTHDPAGEPANEPTEAKEEMIFREVLGHVLSSSSRPRRSQTPALTSLFPSGNKHQNPAKQNSRTPLSDSILALFEKSDEKSNNDSKSEPGVASLLDGLLNPDMTDPALPQEEIEKREKTVAKLKHVYAHIDGLETNRDVLQYYESVVLPQFNADQKELDEEPCSAMEPVVGGDAAALILEKCIVTLSADFKDYTGALHLFEISRNHSIDFFSQACSAEVYNQIIDIRWNQYRDLYAVVNLAAEIAINAIPPTLHTTELLSKVYRDAIDSSRGLGASPYGMPLWTGQEERRLLELNRYRARFQSSWASKPSMLF